MNDFKPDTDYQWWLDDIPDKFICDCSLNYGKSCLYPDKYLTTGCNEEDDK